MLEILSCDGKSCRKGKHVNGGKYLCPHNNLFVLHPKLCEEWDYQNNLKGPHEYLPGSGAKMWWQAER